MQSNIGEEFKIIDCYSTKDCKIKLILRRGNKKFNQIIPFDWYLIIRRTDHEKIGKELYDYARFNPELNIRVEHENEDWTKVKGKYSKRNEIIVFFKNRKITTFEQDLSLVRRYWIDSDNKIADPDFFKLLFIDIEVDDTVSGLTIGQDNVIAFAAKDSDGNEFQFLDSNEKELLTKSIKLMRKYDVMIGWNSEQYDIAYLMSRCEKHRLNFPNICHIDMMQRMIHAYRFDTNIRSYSLDSIAKQFLNKSKVERTSKIIEIFKHDIEKFKEYSLTDVRLLYDLNEKFHVITMALKQAYWCNVTPRMMGQGGHGMYTLLDSLILKELHRRNLKGPSPKYTFDDLSKMTEAELEKTDYPGGLVLLPKPGRYDGVYIFDFKTLYPSIILSSNIGFDTLSETGDIINPSGARFNSKPESILVSVLTDLLTKRKEYKDQKLKLIESGLKETPEYEAVEANEAVVKELGNSVYGIMGAKWGRYFAHRQVVESITLMGQYLLKSLEEFFTSKGYSVLTGDTDSIIIQSFAEINLEEILKEYHIFIKEKLKRECNIENSNIQLNFDRYFKRYILIAKKNYVGHLVNQEGRKTDYVHVRGLETVKSDTCNLATETLKELIDMLLKTDLKQEDYIKWLENKKKTIFNNIKKEDISITKRIRNLKDYKTKSLGAMIAERLIEKGEIQLIKEITYIVTGRKKVIENGKSTNRLDGVAISEFKGDFDKTHYWNTMILKPCNRLLSIVFPSIDWFEYEWENSQKRLF